MHFRYARHTNRLYELEQFYRTFLGLKKLGDFKNHDGYDGIFMGLENESWHLEFTQSEEQVEHSFDEDDVLVFYPGNKKEYEDILNRINEHHIQYHLPKNPYWILNGKHIKDPDGYGIIISPLKLKC